MAAAVGRPTEELLAGVALARACLGTGDEAAGRALARELGTAAYAGAAVHARRELEGLLRDEAGAGAAPRREGRA